MKQVLRLGLISVVALATVASFSATDGGTVNLLAQYHKGEKHGYEIITTVVGMLEGQKQVGMKFGIDLKVLDARKGANTIKLTFQQPTSMGRKVKGFSNNLPIALGNSTVVLDQFNHPVGKSHTGQVFAMFPSRPVKVGEKWEGTSTLAMTASSGQTVSTTYKLTGIKQDAGKRIAILSLTMKGAAPGEGTELVDLADGGILSSVINMKAVTKNGIFPVTILVRRMS